MELGATSAAAMRSWVLPDEPVPVRLMNTIWADRAGVHDDLSTPADLGAWLQSVYRRRSTATVTRHQLADARQLRDALRRIAAFISADTRPAAASSHRRRRRRHQHRQPSGGGYPPAPRLTRDRKLLQTRRPTDPPPPPRSRPPPSPPSTCSPATPPPPCAPVTPPDASSTSSRTTHDANGAPTHAATGPAPLVTTTNADRTAPPAPHRTEPSARNRGTAAASIRRRERRHGTGH